ncbi:hypothetical protein HEE88_001442 [Campylobacter upsaliensis]|uniref:Uncharacterized protein n=2 Tax=Campylobacter TaxID=194 RepID=A0ABS5P2T5_9BACT|nr:hypothetical protein [Campylobacter upsaliensis]ECP7432631.1 hypothetical protein [Campylobacter jejuni]MBS4241006.1 hypothetical protein [Campylobacter vulpis]EAH5200529.1 hypothetical protein [Campylobacter upsaliensis]EAH5217784.1 hypothetical protein [Campylobacter upsaliensis]
MLKNTALILSTALLFSACATKQNAKAKEPSVDSELRLLVGDLKYSDLDKQDEDELIKALLKNSPSFAQNNQQSAIKENMVKLPNKMPLFRQPLFAQMTIFPYVSDEGIYHGYSESWIKIKEGEFVLSDPRSNQDSSERIFDMNDVGAR